MSELSQAIEEMRTMRESYDSLAAASSAYNEGKAELAANLRAKGIEASETESLPALAEKVTQIQTQEITIDGGEMYEEQLYGSPTNVENVDGVYVQTGGSLWNLYEVMAQLKSDPRFESYGGILLAEYFKGYDTIELLNAGAGGAYFTCDGDYYLTDKAGDNAHVWHDNDNGMMNRWVAYLFAAEDTNYTIPSTSLCPRSIHIGRKVGTIICSVAGRIREIVVTDGNELYGTNFSSTQVWQQETVLSTKHNLGGALFNNNSNIVSAILDELEDTTGVLFSSCTNLTAVSLKKITTIPDNIDIFSSSKTNLAYINMPSLTQIIKTYSFNDLSSVVALNLPSVIQLGQYGTGHYRIITSCGKLRYLKMENLTKIDTGNNLQSVISSCSSLEELYSPKLTYLSCRADGSCLQDNPNLKKITFGTLSTWSTNTTGTTQVPFYGCQSIEDIVIGEETNINLFFKFWNPTTVLSTPEGIAQINANIRDHIAANVSDRTGQTSLRFTISTNLYNNLEQATIDAFTAKNWLVAGA